MKELITAVIQTRARAAELKQLREVALAEWNTVHKELLDSYSAALGATVEAEKALRNAALETYLTTGDKRPAPGVEVKMGTRLVYDLSEALRWAMEHGICLDLNIKAFEKVANASPIPFVQVEKVPFAAIATDLRQEEG